MPEPVKFSGAPFFMNGKEYLIPSLSLKQVQDNYDTLSTAAKALSEDTEDAAKTVVDTFRTYVPIIALAIQRNYPEVTEANLWEWLDVGNFADALTIVQSRSGFKGAKTGE